MQLTFYHIKLIFYYHYKLQCLQIVWYYVVRTDPQIFNFHNLTMWDTIVYSTSQEYDQDHNQLI